MAEVLFVDQLLKEQKLVIPSYQRPYKWTKKNIEELLTDMSTALNEHKKYSDDYFKLRYLVNTKILQV